MFVRLGLCNLDCSWCDTPYTWDWSGKNGVAYDRTKELSRVAVDEILNRLHRDAPQEVRRVIVTGGEPMVQANAFASLVGALRSSGWHVEVETNGTLDLPEALRDDPPQINCSPKLANSGIPYDRRIRPDVLRRLVEYGASLKFVVESEHDLDEVHKVVDLAACPPERVWLMPQGTTRSSILAALPDLFMLCARRGWNLCVRLHALTFNDQRGI